MPWFWYSTTWVCLFVYFFLAYCVIIMFRLCLVWEKIVYKTIFHYHDEVVMSLLGDLSVLCSWYVITSYSNHLIIISSIDFNLRPRHSALIKALPSCRHEIRSPANSVVRKWSEKCTFSRNLFLDFELWHPAISKPLNLEKSYTGWL